MIQKSLVALLIRLFFVAILMVLAFILGPLTSVAWNLSVAPVFELVEISYWQGYGFNTLIVVVHAFRKL